MKLHRSIASATAFTSLLAAASPGLAAGPGIGNLTYTDQELFKEIALFDNGNGTPTDSPSKAYGHNVALLLDGYLVFTFAPDSGLASGGWLVYDVSNPREPDLVHSHRTNDTSQLREPHSLPLALVGDRTYVAMQTTFGVQIWDFTNPLDPGVVGSLSLNGVNGGDYADVSWQLSWQWPYLYVAGANRGIYIVDTSDIENPTFVKQVPTSQLGGFRVGPIFALGDRMFISNMDENARYSFLDLRDPSTPALVDTLSIPIRFYSMAVLGDVIVGAGRDGDLLVHEIRNGSIESIRNHRIDGDGLYLSFQDGFIHYGQTGSYKKLTFSDPNNVSVLGNTVLPGHDADHGQTTPFGNLVFIGNDHGSGSALVAHQKEPDTRPPEVAWSFPADGAVNQPTDTILAFTFSDNVDPATLQGNVRLEDGSGAAVAGTITYLTNTLHFRPDAELADDTTYRFVATTGVEDAMGNAFATDHAIVFSTGATATGVGGAGGMAGQGGGGQSGAGQGGAGQGGAGQGGTGQAAAAGVGGAGADGGQGNGGGEGGTLSTGGTSVGGMSGASGASAAGGAAGGGTGGGSAGTGGGSAGTGATSAGASTGGVATGGAGAGGAASGGVSGQGPVPPAESEGCSCRAAGTGAGAPGAFSLLAIAGAFWAFRRRRS
jgi:MYXO-CTERM domain-containing protein